LIVIEESNPLTLSFTNTSIARMGYAVSRFPEIPNRHWHSRGPLPYKSLRSIRGSVIDNCDLEEPGWVQILGSRRFQRSPERLNPVIAADDDSDDNTVFHISG
jgi:hypothetical protein